MSQEAQSAPPLPVLIIDDHALISTSLVIALRAAGVRAERTEIRDVEGVTDLIKTMEPGIAVVDLDLGTAPDGRPLFGGDLVPPLVSAGWRVIVFTGSYGDSHVARAIAAGADGWMHKSAPLDRLLSTIVAASAGENVLPEEQRHRLLHLHAAEQDKLRARQSVIGKLTKRELQVLEGLAAGKRAAAIAKESTVSLATVRAQIRAILSKLDAGSQLEAVAVYRAHVNGSE
jgi:DNA-binding NarL/FixJ family response regulator